MQLLKASRNKRQPGDVFVLRIAAEKYLYGHIIRNDALWARTPNPATAGDDSHANLAYVCDHVAADSNVPDMATLDRDRLLIPLFFALPI